MNTIVSSRRLLTGSLYLLALAGASTAFAQMPDFPEPGTNPADAGSHPPINLVVDYSSTGSGTTEFRGRDRSESGANSVTFMIGGAVPLGGPPKFEEGVAVSPPKWMMPLGLLSQNVYFDEVPGAPVPESVHTLSLNTGLGYRLNDKWMLMANVSPTLYRTDGVGSDDFGIRGGLMAMWRYSPSLTWMFGVMADPDGEFSVLPMVGANWEINPKYTLSLMMPRPQFVYHPNKRWSYHIGANLNGATFRTNDTFGTERGEPRYNHALASYRDIRVSTGLQMRVTSQLALSAEGGYSVNRQIDYTRIDERVKFDPAPYFQLSLRTRF